jgi:superfamily II DNA or RNA helicase
MLFEKKLNELGFKYYQKFEYNNIILSKIYKKENILIIIDLDTIFNTDFSYKRYCQKQNEMMNSFEKVYRFIFDEDEIIEDYLENRDTDFLVKSNFNRSDISIDPSPLEFFFEKCFSKAYGRNSLNYLQREYSVVLSDGSTGYIDYALFNKNGTWIAIEENGLSYHHPYIIKKERYRKILRKQNAVINSNGIVYRWDTESIFNEEKIVDEIKEFIGNINDFQTQNFIYEKRKFEFYEHQENHINQLYKDRNKGIKSSLVVLPVGTGKTVIAIEDIKEFIKTEKKAKILIMSPSIDLKNQWLKVLEKEKLNKFNINVSTYAMINRRYHEFSSDYYDYIIIDEAHHAVAPAIKKVITYFNPKFLLGLTATDKRLDKKKLEDVFGQYNSNLDLKEAIEKGILCPIKAYRLETNIDLSKVTFNGKEYKNSQLEKEIRVPSRNEAIALVLKEYFKDKLSGKSGIVFCVSINHAKEMAKILKEKEINAEAVYGTDKYREEKIEKYMNGEIQFLCTCSLLTEGWDAPHTSVIVMARPTLSQVLYIQQLGRGTRKHPDKESLYVIDIVDEYGSYGKISNRPWSVHSLFNSDIYIKFGDVIKVDVPNNELAILDTVNEIPKKLSPTDIFTFEKLYGDYLSTEELARELFVSTGTVNNWIRKKEIESDIILPFGNGKIHFFKPKKISMIRKIKGLKEHNEKTIVEDFWDFINLGDYTFSYKMYFILSFLDNVDSTGDVVTDKLLETYKKYYIERFEKNLLVDKANSPYNDIEFLKDSKKMKNSMLVNPFEKFERKRFMYYNKDLAKISIHHKIWENLNENNGLERLKNKMLEDIEAYYRK